jgi:hypothetical protein
VDIVEFKIKIMKTIHEHVTEHFDKIKDGRLSIEQLAVVVGCTKATAQQAYATICSTKARQEWKARNALTRPVVMAKMQPIELAPEIDVDVNELIRQAQGVESFDGVRSSVIAVRELIPRIEPLPDGRERVIYQSVMNY